MSKSVPDPELSNISVQENGSLDGYLPAHWITKSLEQRNCESLLFDLRICIESSHQREAHVSNVKSGRMLFEKICTNAAIIIKGTRRRASQWMNVHPKIVYVSER
uniref:Uncharacterized protein n=1 Tax=Glossina palpalis gambiensis TaxID=67801 RepID=A0A1B0BBR1_9MUSC